jgi:hypothetical protein
MKTSTSFATIQARSAYPSSCKRYIAGSRPDLNVAHREMSLSTTRGASSEFGRPFSIDSGVIADCQAGVPASEDSRPRQSQSAPMCPKQTTKPDLVLSVPCNRDGEQSFVLDPPQGVDTFRVVVCCQESKRQLRQMPVVPIAGFSSK